MRFEKVHLQKVLGENANYGEAEILWRAFKAFCDKLYEFKRLKKVAFIGSLERFEHFYVLKGSFQPVLRNK